MPSVTTDSFTDDLARAVIAWAVLSLGFLLPGALGDPDPPPAPLRPRPGRRSVVLHRLNLAAAYPTTVLPALRELTALLHQACTRRWDEQEHKLALAPAFRTP